MRLRGVGAIAVKVKWRLGVLHVLRRVFLAFVTRGAGAESRVLVVQLDNLGDVALAAGALTSTIRAFPNKEVHLLVDRAAEEVAKQLTDRVIAVDRHALRATLLSSAKILGDLKRTGYDTVVHHSTIQLGLIEYYSAISAIGASQRIGYAGEAIFAAPAQQHWYDRFALRFVLPALEKTYTTLVPSFDERSSGRKISHVLHHYEHFFRGFTAEGKTFDAVPVLRALESRRPKPYAVIGLGAAVAYRRWPVERFVEVARKLEERGLELVLVGSPAERGLGDVFVALMPTAVNLIGSTSIAEVCELIAGAQVVVCNETAFAHITVALKRPLACVTGGGHLGRCSLHGYASTVWVHAPSPCDGDNWACGRSLSTGQVAPCIEVITVDMVTRGVNAALEASHNPGAFHLP